MFQCNETSASAYVVKALKDLHQKNLIVSKGSGTEFVRDPQALTQPGLMRYPGKYVIYQALQHSQDGASIADLASLDADIVSLRESVIALQSDEKLLPYNIACVKCPLSLQGLESSVESLEAEKTSLLERLAWMESGVSEALSPEERADVNRLWSYWSRRTAAARWRLKFGK